MHEMIQSYLQSLYQAHDSEIKESMFSVGNEIYGELYYYSALTLLRHLNLTAEDHFLDIGFGLGKLILQVSLITPAQHITGIEINPKRCIIASNLLRTAQQQLPDWFENKNISLITGDFLQSNFSNITVVYVCNTVFSQQLLEGISKKINEMQAVKKVVSFRKLPNLANFKLTQKLFLHGSWDHVAYYLYLKKNNEHDF